MAASNKVFIVQPEQRIVGAQKLGVKDDFDSIFRTIKQLDASDLIQDRIVGIIGHIMRDDGRKGISLQCKDTAFQGDHILVLNNLLCIWQFSPTD